jgi:hypothetical protein
MDFWKSRKFAYAVTMLFASLLIAFVPVAFDLDAEQADVFYKLVPLAAGMGFYLMIGHTVMDAYSIAKGLEIPKIADAVDLVIDAVEETRIPADG